MNLLGRSPPRRARRWTVQAKTVLQRRKALVFERESLPVRSLPASASVAHGDPNGARPPAPPAGTGAAPNLAVGETVILLKLALHPY